MTSQPSCSACPTLMWCRADQPLPTPERQPRRDWYAVPAAGMPLLRPGQHLPAGTPLGPAFAEQPIILTCAGYVRSIQYDLDRDELLIELQSEVGG